MYGTAFLFRRVDTSIKLYDTIEIKKIIAKTNIGLKIRLCFNEYCFDRTMTGQCHKYREYDIFPI